MGQRFNCNGSQWLYESIQSNEVHAYQLQAGIALEHCLANSFENTNWQSIYQQYIILARLDNNPIVALNRTIAQFYYGEQKAALEALLQLGSNKLLSQNPLYHSTVGQFYTILGKKKAAFNAYTIALQHSQSNMEQMRIKEIMANLEKK